MNIMAQQNSSGFFSTIFYYLALLEGIFIWHASGEQGTLQSNNPCTL